MPDYKIAAACSQWELYHLDIKTTPIATDFKPWLKQYNVGFSRKAREVEFNTGRCGTPF